MNTSTISPLLEGAAKLARQLADRKTAANSAVDVPAVYANGVAPDAIDVSRKQVL